MPCCALIGVGLGAPTHNSVNATTVKEKDRIIGFLLGFQGLHALVLCAQNVWRRARACGEGAGKNVRLRINAEKKIKESLPADGMLAARLQSSRISAHPAGSSLAAYRSFITSESRLHSSVLARPETGCRQLSDAPFLCNDATSNEKLICQRLKSRVTAWGNESRRNFGHGAARPP